MRSACLALLSVFVFGLNCGLVLGQKTGRVEGRVVAAETGAPLADATVGVETAAQPRGTTTDAEGRFVIDGLSSGTAVLQVRHVGYVATTRTVQVQAGQTTRLTVELVSATVELAGLEITGATRSARAAIPGAASKVGAAALEQMDPIGTQAALKHVPGVYGLADDGMTQTRMSVGIRGLQPRRTQRVLVMEDGMPIQPAPYVFSPLYYNPPIERIEEIEVIKGSATIRHGPQTMAGVINYVTSRPQRRTPGGTLELTPGTNGYVSAFGELGGFGTEDVRPQVQLLVKRGDGFRQNNDFRQVNGTAKVQANLGDSRSLYLKLNADYERLNATYTGLTPYSFRTDPDFNPKDDDLYRIYRASLGTIYNRRYSDQVQGTTRLYANVFHRPWWREKDVFVKAKAYQDPNVDAEPVPPNTPGPLMRVGISDALERNLTLDDKPYFGNVRTFYVTGVEHSLDIQHSLFGLEADLELGGRLHWERFKDNRKISDEVGVREGVFYQGDVSDPGPVSIIGGSSVYETRALSLYALEDMQWGPLRLSPGFRLEVFEQSRINRLKGSQYRDQTSVVPLPGLGFNWNLGTADLGATLGESNARLFGGIHRGYTPPSTATFAIVGFDPPSATGGTSGGFDLKAEKSWNSELGVRGRSAAGQFQITGFYLYVEDLVGGRTSFQQNLGVVESYGLEARTRVKGGTFAGPLPTLDVSYTYLQSAVVQGIITSAIDGTPEDISGNELPAAPTHTATVGLSKTFSEIGLTLSTDLSYTGRFYTDLENLEQTNNRGERGPVPAHTVLDAGATYEYSDALSVQLTAKNVTDNVYIGSRLHSNPSQPSANLSTGIIPGPRRQINLSIQYDF
ncbi:MAG: TonB-dependent receptor domain-containing protein [Salinibacter sp.]|uniref:TonB-dependent receptor domain-containing protein n=1 Tax=Salinibacter sp. TaxID=2065818 RepID=UPI0035D48C30